MGAESSSKEIANRLIHWLRDYAVSRIDSYLIDTQCNVPPHIYLDLGHQGFFGMHVSRRYGGLELTTYDMLRVIQQIAAIDLTLATIVIESIQGAHTLEKYGSEAMKNRYLPKLAEGRVFTAGAMTESAAGSNPRAMKSVAIPDENAGWLLNGSKRWVGMGASADVIAIYVQQLDSENNWLGMSGFLVPQGTEGLEIGPESPTMGIRGFPKNTIHMHNINVSTEHLLGNVGEGMEIAQDNMMYIRLCLAAASIGAMKHCVQLMYRYAERRTVATGQLADNPVTLIKLSEITAIIEAIENFIALVSNFFDNDPSIVPEEMFVVAKILGSEYLGWIADFCVQLLGARGYEEASGVSKIFRDARVFRIFEGPSEALNMYIGSKILEENKRLECFVCETLQQSQLFNEMKLAINQVNEYCIANKNNSFSKPFTAHYWAQSVVGEVLTYGLILCGIEYNIKLNYSDELNRAKIWIRNKYNNVLQCALTGSLGEKTLIKSSQLHDIIYKYTDAIGNIEQSRKTQDIVIDCLLKNEQEKECHTSGLLIEHQSPNERVGLNDKQNDRPLIATEAERQQLLHEWNNVENGTIRPKIYVHHLFEEQVTQCPDEIAVIYDDESLTYHELNSRANKLAHFLKIKGLSNNALVAIYMERSIAMIVSILGILKAGGAYLPLDHHYPLDSLKFMFNDAGSTIVLSHKKWTKSIPFSSEQVVFYEDIPSDLSDENLSRPVNIDDTCYAIYTSGSSGQPKGVSLPHQSLTNLILWHREKIPEKRNVLQFTSLNFDMSFLEIFAALSSGGSLTLISEKDRIDMETYAEIVMKNNIQQLIMPITFLKSLAASTINRNKFNQVKEIIVAGEQVTITHDLLSFFDHCSTSKLLNYYGPSETHVVTTYEFPKNTADWPHHPPIGRAISNTAIFILNEEMQIVPIGTLGEIYISGVSLAKGYIRRDELTKERFIDNPWGEDQHIRLYKTGDYGKFLPDGNIVFVGRKDNQIKMRGFRIELQEIESKIIKFPGIQEVIVITKKNGMGEQCLEAFLVTRETENEHGLFEDLLKFLKDKLPLHMIPSSFHVIEKMPLTSSGKINRRALENHGNESIRYSKNYTHMLQPTSPTEKRLVNIMEDFFKIHVGINYSFTSIGGNSLLAAQIVARIHHEFSVELPVYSVLSDASIADTAKRIDLLLNNV